MCSKVPIGLMIVLLTIGGGKLQSVSAQEVRVVVGTVFEGDTIPVFKLNELTVRPTYTYLTAEEIKKNQRLIRNVKKTLPYAKLGKQRLDLLEKEVASMSKKKRKDYIKTAEKEMMDEFGEELKHLSISQGKVLLKLIDRETGRTSYVLVNELRGKLRAGFYQTFAKLFGYNLKKQYNPNQNKEDNLIERIVLSIEAGKL